MYRVFGQRTPRRSAKDGRRLVVRLRLRFSAAALASLLCGALTAAAAVPPPSETPAEVIVSGRASTARNVRVVAVGNEIPRTFSGKRLHNTPGFAWYVSRHYALKTDYPPAKARQYLTLLEMAYPHYVELFGAEPPGIEQKRMAVCYASSADQLRKALAGDGIRWDFRGGGITYEKFNCAYQYPSGSLRYHQRYILLHECTHLFQMCLTGAVFTTPPWFYEGLADLLANHVRDGDARRVIFNVVDKATTNNPFDQGLRAWRKARPAFSAIHAGGGGSRGIWFLMAAFFQTDPDRAQRLRIYRDEMFRRGLRGRKVAEASAQLLQELLGPAPRAKPLPRGGAAWAKIDAAFRTWVEARRNTFHYAEWGWEQDANTLWSYGFARGGRLSRTDVYLAPGEPPAPDPLRMDYPPAAVSPLVGHVKRGAAEPAVGALLDFSRNPAKGVAGIGLGLIDGQPIVPFAEGMLFADAAGKKPGIQAAAYHKGIVIDAGRRSRDVANGKLIRRGVDARIALGAKGSASRGLKSNFVAEWDGWLKIDKAGPHEFALASDDGSWLWIDGKQVIDNGGLHTEELKTGKVTLAAGMHRIRIRYFQGYGEAALKVGLAPKQRPGCLRLLVGASRELILDGTDLGLPKTVVALPEPFRKAIAAGGHKVGLNARIAKDALAVTLRARDPEAARAATFVATVPLAAEQRTRLLTLPGTLLARGGYHGVTPFFDEHRGMRWPDLSVPAPPNRWRNPGDKPLYRLYRAAWRLGDHAPPSLKALKAAMLAAVDQPPAAQKHALLAFSKQLPAVRKDIAACGASAERIRQALAELKAPAPRPPGRDLR